MNTLRQRLQGSPATARVLPFAIFLALTLGQGRFFAGSEFWFYLAKTLVGAWLVWEMRGVVTEMRWAFSREAVLTGIAVFLLWVALDPFYPKPAAAGGPWNPHTYFGHDSSIAWLFVVMRLVGSTVVVPPLEEVFYRSFLYRYLLRPDFLSVPFNHFAWRPLLITAAVFGLAHREWLAGILCALAYQWLALRRNRLGDALTAHAITNLLLGLWVVCLGKWHFW